MGNLSHLTGDYDRVLDDRYRVVVPAPWRRALNDEDCAAVTLMCSPSLDGGHLELRTAEQFDRWVSQLAKDDPSGRISGVKLSMLSHCKQVELDSRGSVTLPEFLVRFVALKRDVTWRGQTDHMQLTNRNNR